MEPDAVRRGRPARWPRRRKPVMVYLEPEVVELAKRQAEQDRRPLATYIRLLVEDALAERERKGGGRHDDPGDTGPDAQGAAAGAVQQGSAAGGYHSSGSGLSCISAPDAGIEHRPGELWEEAERAEIRAAELADLWLGMPPEEEA